QNYELRETNSQLNCEIESQILKFNIHKEQAEEKVTTKQIKTLGAKLNESESTLALKYKQCEDSTNKWSGSCSSNSSSCYSSDNDSSGSSVVSSSNGSNEYVDSSTNKWSGSCSLDSLGSYSSLNSDNDSSGSSIGSSYQSFFDNFDSS
ncbi:hypothetical protein DICPUDRAFT_150974, partial [Dictyostelium purpureum]